MFGKELKNKICAVTGGAGVIGTAICKSLAQAGIKTAVVDLDGAQAQKLAKYLSETYSIDCLGVSADVLDKDSLIEAKKHINDNLGKIDFLINGAGGNSPQATTKVEQMDETSVAELSATFFGLQKEGFQKVFDLNFMGTILPTMVFSTDMLENKKGAVINISSMNSFKPLTKIPAYSAAKASINNFTQWLAVHLAKTGIRVNAIAPGFFLTNQNRFLLIDEETGHPTPRGEKIIANTPMGRYGDVEELSGTVLYLLSEMSAFVSGVVIPVDGGYSAYGGV
jgi:NAD(P)-dependent dehydrogenase (short-subunit alcohol dehydrogenase family)